MSKPEAINVCPICDIARCAHIREPELKATIARQVDEIGALKAGMRGDYDLDAWLDWSIHQRGLRQAMAQQAAEIDRLKTLLGQVNHCTSIGSIIGSRQRDE